MSTFRRLWDLTKRGNDVNIFLYFKDVRKAQKRASPPLGSPLELKELATSRDAL